MTHTRRAKEQLSALSVAALGVVYGDIGTSPLYTMKEAFANSHHHLPVTDANILGILSLIFWVLILIVTVKYVTFILRADNKGEGGIMALMALALRNQPEVSRSRNLILALGLFGATLFYGESLVTPAISVLSAVEGLEVVTPALGPLVIPVTLGILVALFTIQRRGSGGIGRLFGPVMGLWFISLAMLGLLNIIAAPEVLRALDPSRALHFLTLNPKLGFFTLGAVVLAITGAEALYADMGHFGRKPIRMAWYGLVLPSLVLNYFGQGALLLSQPEAIGNPFFRMSPGWLLYPLVTLATAAAVIASQAVISGAFSVTRQAIQLGYLPRLHIQHTSDTRIGQIYLPAINWMMLTMVIVLVLSFGSSSDLAAAYGISVAGTMLITSILAFFVARDLWGWRSWWAFCAALPFVLIDLTLFSACTIKIIDGGWFPLAFGSMLFLLLTTWKRGRALLQRRLVENAIESRSFIQSVSGDAAIRRVPGTAIFLTSDPDGIPHALLHSLKHYKVLHERVALLSVTVLDISHVADAPRVTVEALPDQFWRIRVYYGFMDEPDLPEALTQCAEQGLEIDMMQTSFFIGRETPIARSDSELSFWRGKIFVAMYRNAGSAADFFRLPPNRVVEMGAQVVL